MVDTTNLDRTSYVTIVLYIPNFPSLMEVGDI